ncbi:MAG: ketopantoate reductase family protein [Nitrospiria bacterium]
MKVLIVGAGALGGYFGALLQQNGVDVTFMVRAETFEIIRTKGLIVESVNGNMIVHPKLILASDLNSPFDLIILTVKCYDLEEVFKEIEPAVSSQTWILTLQNGIDTEDRAASHFGKGHIIGGVAFITAKLIEKGRIGHYKRGVITIGELNGEISGRLSKIHKLLTDANITAYMTGDIMKKKWEKLCWNATFNPLSVILNGPVSDILKSPGALSVIRQVIQEIICVGKENGIILKDSIIDDTIQNSFELKEFYTSMYEDWKIGKLTENRYLSGMVYQKSLTGNIQTPMSFILYQAVETITHIGQSL